MDRAEVAQHLDVLGATDDVHQADAVGGADPHEHLSEVGRGGGVDEGAVTLGAHRLDHRQRGQRVDEQRRALGAADVVGELDDRGRLGHAVVSPHRAAEQGDATTEQRGRFRACGDHRAGALVADGQRLVQPVAIERAARPLGRSPTRAPPVGPQRPRGDRAQQHAEIRRVDRRRFDGHHHLAAARLGNIDARPVPAATRRWRRWWIADCGREWGSSRETSSGSLSSRRPQPIERRGPSVRRFPAWLANGSRARSPRR